MSYTVVYLRQQKLDQKLLEKINKQISKPIFCFVPSVLIIVLLQISSSKHCPLDEKRIMGIYFLKLRQNIRQNNDTKKISFETTQERKKIDVAA